MNLLDWIVTILCLFVFAVFISYGMQKAYYLKEVGRMQSFIEECEEREDRMERQTTSMRP